MTTDPSFTSSFMEREWATPTATIHDAERVPADPWAPLTALLWLAFVILLICSPAIVWAICSWGF